MRRMMGFGLCALVVLALPAVAAPDCAGEREIANAQIMRIEPNGVLVMTDGRALKLDGIRLPNGAGDHAPAALAEAAKAAVAELTKSGPLEVHAVWPKEDRYDRVRGQIFTADGTWIQRTLLRQGLARVELSPDRGECYRELYAAETEARQAKAGLWASRAYALRSPETLKADGSYQLVVGRVASATKQDGTVTLSFEQSPRFTVVIDADDLKTFALMGVDPLNYDGHLVRVRGVVQSGPQIAIGNPKQVELLQ